MLTVREALTEGSGRVRVWRKKDWSGPQQSLSMSVKLRLAGTGGAEESRERQSSRTIKGRAWGANILSVAAMERERALRVGGASATKRVRRALVGVCVNKCGEMKLGVCGQLTMSRMAAEAINPGDPACEGVVVR